MEKQFVNFEIAKKLKEKGYNEPCIAEFFIGKSPKKDYSKDPWFGLNPDILDENPDYSINLLKDWISARTAAIIKSLELI